MEFRKMLNRADTVPLFRRKALDEFRHAIRQFGFGDEKIPLRIEGLSREQLLWRPEGRGNHLVWILGHVAASRGNLLTWLGAGDADPVDEREEEWFGIGSELRDGDPYPATEGLLRRIHGRGRSLAALLASFGPEDAERELEYELPFGPTVRAALAFMLFHEAFHVGQLSYLCGLEGNPLGA